MAIIDTFRPATPAGEPEESTGPLQLSGPKVALPVQDASKVALDDAETVVVDVCRLENGLITDVWEIIEPVSGAEANLRWWDLR